MNVAKSSFASGKIFSALGLLCLCACLGDGYVELDGGGYYQPYYEGMYGGWEPEYRIGPYRSGVEVIHTPRSSHSYRSPGRGRAIPSIPTRSHGSENHRPASRSSGNRN